MPSNVADPIRRSHVSVPSFPPEGTDENFTIPTETMRYPYTQVRGPCAFAESNPEFGIPVAEIGSLISLAQNCPSKALRRISLARYGSTHHLLRSSRVQQPA